MQIEKRCPQCTVVKPAAEFYQRGEFLMSYCKPCQRAHVKVTRDALRARLRSLLERLKDRPCTDCGERHPKWAMEFDHLDPTLKKFTISTAAGRGLKEASVLAEIEKCEVVCVLCHRYRTFGSKRFPVISSVG